MFLESIHQVDMKTSVKCLKSFMIVFQDSSNLTCEADGKNPEKDIGSKGIGAFWP